MKKVVEKQKSIDFVLFKCQHVPKIPKVGRNLKSGTVLRLFDLFKIEHVGIVSSLTRHLHLEDVVLDRDRREERGHPCP